MAALIIRKTGNFVLFRICKQYSSFQKNSTGLIDDEADDHFKNELLDASLPFVLDHGWSQKSLSCGAKQLNISLAAAGIFKDGPAALALHLYKRNNEKLEDYLNGLKTKTSSVEDDSFHDFLSVSIRERIRLTVPFKPVWPEAMLIYSHPRNAAHSVALLRDLTDIILSQIGDKSTNISWYYKRALIAALYKSAELVFLQDKTPDLSQTEDFIIRRAANVGHCMKYSNTIAGLPDDLVNAASIGRVTAFNMLGLNR